MPFTPSHAVVALPFLRSPLIPGAIAVGAMTPDLPLFTRNLPLPYPRTHDPLWLPATVCLALVLLLVWRCVVRPAARELSPRWLAARLPESWDAGAAASARQTFAGTPGDARPRTSWRALGLLVVSLALGVLSHILWDQFTHEGRAGVDALPVLDAQWGPIAGYSWLQHGSSALGLAAIGVWMLLWTIRRRPVSAAARLLPAWLRWTWWLSLPLMLVVAWVVGLSVYGPLDAEFTAAHLAYRVLPRACGLWGAATLALCLVVAVRRQRARQAPIHSGGS